MGCGFNGCNLEMGLVGDEWCSVSCVMWCSVWWVVGGVWCVGYGVWGVLGVGGVVLGTMSHCGSPCAWRPRGGPRTQPCA